MASKIYPLINAYKAWNGIYVLVLHIPMYWKKIIHINKLKSERSVK